LEENYFLKVKELSPTRFWINNPTPVDADKAIMAGAISCTTNPTYAMKQILKEDEKDYVLNIVDEVVKDVKDDNEACDLIQQKLVKRILNKFLPLYEKNPGKEGFVSIQGNPFTDDDANHIVEEALQYRKLGKNFIAKIPATKAGLTAIEKLIPENIPIIITEVMGIAQAIYACEMYERVSRECGKYPPFYLTHITGILDDHLKNVVKRDNIDISPDILWQAGCIVARKQYKIFKERKYFGTMLGGGARGLHHFTEMVGSEMHVTINWTGTADRLIEANPPVMYRMFNPVPQKVVDELLEKIPDFRRAYMEDGLTVDEFKDFGPVVLFRDSFLKGWTYMLKIIQERRKKII